VSREADERRKHRGRQELPRARRAPDEPTVGGSVIAQPGRGPPDRPVERGCRPVVERMRELDRRVDPLEPVLGEGQGPEEGRCDAGRVKGRADVVDEARQRQLGRARSPAEGVRSLPDENPLARPCELDRRGEPVRPAPDDDRVVAAGYAPTPATPARREERPSRTISRAITSRWISFVPS
jgi:hypothetical protein